MKNLQEFSWPYYSLFIFILDTYLMYQIKMKIQGLAFFSNPLLSRIKILFDYIDAQTILIYLFCFACIFSLGLIMPFFLITLIIIQGFSLMTNMFILAIIFIESH